MRRTVGWVVMALAVPLFPAPADAGDARQTGKPQLNLRASPRMSFPPSDVLLVAELKGGAPSEEFYCPRLEWSWGDGSRSVEESDCPPFESGAEFERYFSARHVYRAPGSYEVRVTMLRADRAVAFASVDVVMQGDSHPMR